VKFGSVFMKLIFVMTNQIYCHTGFCRFSHLQQEYFYYLLLMVIAFAIIRNKKKSIRNYKRLLGSQSKDQVSSTEGDSLTNDITTEVTPVRTDSTFTINSDVVDKPRIITVSWRAYSEGVPNFVC